MPKQLALLQQLESPCQPPQQQVQAHTQHQALAMALLTSRSPLPKQHVETDQLTSMATQWSCSTPMLLLVTQEQNKQFMHQAGQCQHNMGYVGTLEFCPPQVNGDGRFSQPAPCYNSGINIRNALEGYSS